MKPYASSGKESIEGNLWGSGRTHSWALYTFLVSYVQKNWGVFFLVSFLLLFLISNIETFVINEIRLIYFTNDRIIWWSTIMTGSLPFLLKDFYVANILYCYTDLPVPPNPSCSTSFQVYLELYFSCIYLRKCDCLIKKTCSKGNFWIDSEHRTGVYSYGTN